VDFDTRDQLLILYSAFVKYLKKGNTKKRRISCLQAAIKSMIQLRVRTCIKVSLNLVSI
jgi:hypothetical protein